MQKVVRLSALTYDCTHVTPSSAFCSITAWQMVAPSSATGISSRSGKVRCTTYRGIQSSSWTWVLNMARRYDRAKRSASAGAPTLEARDTQLRYRSPQPGITPVRRLADVLRTRRRPGQEQQEGRHDDLERPVHPSNPRARPSYPDANRAAAAQPASP